MNRNTRWLLVALIALAPLPATAADLLPATSRAYDAYVEQARRAFLDRVRSDTGIVRNAEPVGRPARGDGITELPGGLVHHWTGSVFVRGTTLEKVLALSRAYSSYTRIYTDVIASRLLAQDGNKYRALLRLKEGGAGITAVLEMRTATEYFQPTARQAYAISSAEEIREVADAGTPEERLLPAGRDSGYLWRANTFTRFVRVDAGVYIEMETVGLSREFPPLMGWIIEPIARRLGRKSVESSLREFVAAL